MDKNVVWKTDGIMVKGRHHNITGNLALEKVWRSFGLASASGAAFPERMHLCSFLAPLAMCEDPHGKGASFAKLVS